MNECQCKFGHLLVPEEADCPMAQDKLAVIIELTLTKAVMYCGYAYGVKKQCYIGV